MKNLLKLLFCAGIIIASGSCKKNSRLTSDSDPSTSESVQKMAKPQTLAITQQIGVNFNAALADYSGRTTDLSKTHTGWVRGIISFFPLYNAYKNITDVTARRAAIAADPEVAGYLSIPTSYYKALSIRYRFASFTTKDSLIPYNAVGNYPGRDPARLALYMDFLTDLLNVVMPQTEIVVVGNEPFIDCSSADISHISILEFYKEAAWRTKLYKTNHPTNTTRIYMGAFDDAYRAARQNNVQYQDMIKFVRGKDWIEGVDLHIHHRENSEINPAINFVLNTLNDPSKKFIITEYSLKNWWDDKVSIPISTAFTALYPQPARIDLNGNNNGIKEVWEYINDATYYKRTRLEWDAWNANSTWLEERKGYICSSFDIFNNHPEFWVAFYALRQGDPTNTGFSLNDGTWILNPLLVSKTVIPGSDGFAQKRYTFFNDFVALRDGTPTSCGF